MSAKLAVMTTEIAQIVRKLPVRPIETNEEAHALTALLVRWKQASGELEREMKERLAPLKKAEKDVRAEYALVLEPGERFEKAAKGCIADFQRREAARIAREQAAAFQAAEDAAILQAEAEARGDTAGVEKADLAISQALMTAPVDAVRGFRGNMGSANVRKRWTFEIVDAESVPRGYCEPDLAKIRRAVQAGERMIDGVNIYETADVAVRIG